MIHIFRMVLLTAIVASSMTVGAVACTVECNEGEAYSDEAEL